jgi:hypothetical protein
LRLREDFLKGTLDFPDLAMLKTRFRNTTIHVSNFQKHRGHKHDGFRQHASCFWRKRTVSASALQKHARACFFCGEGPKALLARMPSVRKALFAFAKELRLLQLLEGRVKPEDFVQY